MTTETRDKHGRPIRVGDVLKVFHFTGAHRKKHFMYKQVTRTQYIGGYMDSPKVLYFFVSHLTLKEKDGYLLGMNEGLLNDYEILQSLDGHPERMPKTLYAQGDVT